MYKIGFFASGGGSNFGAIVDQIKSNDNPISPEFLLSNNSKSGAVEKAKNYGIPHYHISGKTHTDKQAYDQAILDIIEKHNIDLLILAGFMKKIPDPVIKKMSNRIVNIHPALLPSFGGHGFYGMNVHQAAYEEGVRISGATVHLVNEEYDRGAIIKQDAVPLSHDDSPEDIAAKVLKIEHRIFYQVVKAFSEGKVSFRKDRLEYYGE